jgi:cytochrome c-type biogenesis protein CcmH/NrfG
MNNLARAYELKGDRTNALETYRQLLRHYPEEQNWKKKVEELAKSL